MEVLKINSKKTLEINANNFDAVNKDVNILEFKAENLFSSLNFNNFQNVFWVVIQVKDENSKIFNAIEEKRFNLEHPVFVQVFIESLKTFKIYQFLDKFEEVKDEENFDAFAKFVKNQNFSLLDLKISNFLEFLSLSQSEENFLIKKAIKSKNENLIKLLMQFTAQINRELIIEAFKLKNIKYLTLILRNFDSSDMTDELLELIYNSEIIEEIFKNVFDQNCIKALKVLLKNSSFFAKTFGFTKWNELRNENVKKKYFAFLFEVQKVEENFYAQFFSENFLEIFHKNIQKGNFEEIKNFVEKFPNFKFCADENQKCAIDKSIEAEEYEIYSFLLSEGFLTYDQKQLDLKISKLPQAIRTEIQKNNLKFLKPNPENFINILCTKCELFGLSDETDHGEIREMITKLGENQELRPLLERAAETDLKNVFDFKTKSVHLVNPVSNEKIMGIAYHKKDLMFVGADEGKYERYGTFIHEMTHLILFLVYDNDCLPYCKGDTVRENLWNEIFRTTFKTYQKNSKTDKIIFLAFKSYREVDKKKLELAVRVNHILARYMNDQTKINEIQAQFPEIFQFNLKVIDDLKIPNVYNLISLNNNFGVLKRVQESNLQVEVQKSSDLLKIDEKFMIFSSNVPQLTFSRIVHEIFNNSENKLNLKVKNIFLDPERLEQEHFRKIFLNFLVKNKIERIFVDLKSLKDKNLNLFVNLANILQIIFICDDDEKICGHFETMRKEEITHEWTELTEESKIIILESKINFQGNFMNLKNFLTKTNKINSKMLKFLCKQEIKINCNIVKVELKSFIARKVEKKIKKRENNFENNFFQEDKKKKKLFEVEKFEYQEFLLESFMENVRNDLIVLISDMAGSGKTSALWKFYEILLEQFPDFWIIFISLKDHTDDLTKSVDESFLNFIIKILKLDPLEAEIFTQKFAKGEVKIIFDAFDEVSPKCKKETLNYFKLFKEQEKNQIWITTRTHLEHDLESGLKVFAHRLKILDKSEQIKFLKEIWKNSNESEEFIDDCAKNLVHKISDMISSNPSVIGLPLIVEGLANFYIEEINENFSDKIEKLKISTVYDNLIIKANFKILNSKFPEKVEESSNKSDSILNVHQYLAIVHFFNEELAENLSLNYDEDEWTLEEISRGGIVKYGKDQRVQFNHETYAEFLIATVMIKIIKTTKKPTKFQLELFDKILSQENFQITRMFLDEMLERFNDKKFFDFYIKTVELSTFRFIAQEGLFNIFEIIFNRVKISKVELYKNLFETQDEKLKKTIFMEILPKVKIIENFEKISSEIFEFYGEKVFENFTLRVDADGNTILHLMTAEKVKSEIFNLFTEKFIKKEKLEEIIFMRNKNQETFLHFTVYERNLEKLQNVFDFISNKLEVKQQKKLIKLKNLEARNILHSAALYYENGLELILDYALKLFDQSEFQKLVQEVDEEGHNILHYAALFTKSEDNFEYFWFKISKNIENKKEFFMHKGNSNRNVLLFAASNEKNPQIFEFVFNTAISFCESNEELKNLILEKNSENHILLTFAAVLSPKLILEFLFKEIFEIFDESEMKNLLKTTKGFKGRNLLTFAAGNNSKDSIEFLWEIFEKYLSRDEIFELLKESDEDDVNILTLAAGSATSVENIEYLWSKFAENTENKKEFFMRKNNLQRTVLQISAQNQNDPQVFNFILNLAKSFCENKNEFKNLILEKDSESLNVLTSAAAFAPLSNLELLFEIILEIFDDNEIKNLLKNTRGFKGRNLLKEAATYNENKNSIEFLWNVFEENLNRDEILELLNEKDEIGDNILHLAAGFVKSKEIFYVWWLKISEHIGNKKEFFMRKNNLQRNILQLSALNENDPKIFQLVLSLAIDFCENEEEIKNLYSGKSLDNLNLITLTAAFSQKLNLEFLFEKILAIFGENELKNVLRTSKEHEAKNLITFAVQNKNKSSIEFLWKMIEENFNREDIFEFINHKHEGGCNILHLAAYFAKSEEIFEFFWFKVLETFSNHFEDLKELKNYLKMKDFRGRNILIASLLHKNENSFFYIFENIFCQFMDLKNFIYDCDQNGENFLQQLVHFCPVSMLEFGFKKLKEKLSDEESKNLILEKNSKDVNLISLAALFASKSNLEFLFEQTFEIFVENAMKTLLISTKVLQMNLLTLSAIKNTNKDSIEFLWKTFEENLSREEIFELLNEKDENNCNILHLAAQFAKSEEIFELFWLKIFENLLNTFKNEKDLESFIKLKDIKGRNILFASIYYKNDNSFFFIYENIFCHFLDFKNFIYECDENGENFLHFLAKFGSLSMLESAIKKLLEELSEEEFKIFVRIKGENLKCNLLHCAAQNSNLTSISYVCSMIELGLGEVELKNMLNEEDINGDFPHLLAFKCNTLQNFMFLKNKFEEHF